MRSLDGSPLENYALRGSWRVAGAPQNRRSVQMNRYILLAALFGLAAFATGCQNAGHAEADVDANRPVLAAETTTPYTVAYVAKTDTPWFYSSTDTTAAGTL